MYLSELVTRLESPSEARRVNAHLKSMKVKGALLAPALKLLSDSSNLQVRQSHWTESTRPGVLTVQTTVVVQPKSTAVADQRVFKFRVLAEFQGTAEGTMLANLDFRESE